MPPISLFSIHFLVLFSSSVIVAPSNGFQLGKLWNQFPKILDSSGAKASNNLASTKAKLIKAISDTSNGKDADLETQKEVLLLVQSLETTAPVSPQFLASPEEAQQLNGTWFLQYTAPSDIDVEDVDSWTPKDASEGEARINTEQANLQGSVRASGLTVDTANRVTRQIIDTTNQRIFNNVEQDFGMISVGGSFRISETVPNRAIVAFDTAKITLNHGPVLDLGFLFNIISVFRGGNRDNGWLETTYLDDDIRIGRGNKGSLFVLTREESLPSLL